MVTKEMICAAHDICLKKGDFVLSASLLERIYLAMRDKADGRDSAGWDAYEDLRKASDEMVLNLRQRVQELEKERDGLIAKNQNIFNALMASTQKNDNLYASIKSASGHLNLYGLFSCVEGDSYDPECADKNVRKANSILKAELTTEVIKPAGKEDQAVYDSIARNYYK